MTEILQHESSRFKYLYNQFLLLLTDLISKYFVQLLTLIRGVLLLNPLLELRSLLPYYTAVSTIILIYMLL